MKEVPILSMISANDMPIALDIGNVIIGWNPEAFIKPFIEHLCVIDEGPPVHYHPDPIEWLSKVQPLQDLGISSIKDNLDLHFPSVDGRLLDEINEAWTATLEPNEEMMYLVEEWIKYRKVALCSNMGYQHLSFLRKNLSTIFNNTIQHISCEVGARKPTKLFYQSFLMENPDFYGAWYLDDIQENVSAATKAGFNAHVFHIGWLK